MAVKFASSNHRTDPWNCVEYLGIDLARSTEEEDFPHEEEAQTDGWKGSQGRYGTEHLHELW